MRPDPHSLAGRTVSHASVLAPILDSTKPLLTGDLGEFYLAPERYRGEFQLVPKQYIETENRLPTHEPVATSPILPRWFYNQWLTDSLVA